MIIKFDHISYSCTYEEELPFIKELDGYTTVFREEHLPNIACKERYLKHKQLDHTITLLQSNNGIPIEITAYRTCTKEKAGFDFRDSVVQIYSQQEQLTQQLLVDMGFKSEDNVWKLKPFLDSKDIKVKVEATKRSKQNYYLDTKGYTSVAFVISHMDKERGYYNKLGYTVSEVEKLMVNNHELKICFLEGKAGELIEFISL